MRFKFSVAIALAFCLSYAAAGQSIPLSEIELRGAHLMRGICGRSRSDVFRADGSISRTRRASDKTGPNTTCSSQASSSPRQR